MQDLPETQDKEITVIMGAVDESDVKDFSRLPVLLTAPLAQAGVPTPGRYRTELCRHFTRRGSCRHGRRCAFAHGADELRPTGARNELTRQSPAKLDHRKLVEEVWNTQRKSYAHRELWHRYCDDHLAGTRDPSWHSSKDLQAFLEHLAARPVLCAQQGDFHAKLVEGVKAIQKGSPQRKAQWKAYCETNITGKRPLLNPAMHEPASLQAFLDGIAGSTADRQGDAQDGLE